MGYKEKPYLKLYKVINGAFSFVAVIDDYQDFSTETKLYEAGNFTCTINLNIPNANKFERGMFIWVDGAFWEITTITDSIGSDGKGSQIRQITGYDARYILKRRIIRNMNAEGKYEFYAKGELCLRNLVYDQCGLGTVEKRRLPIINTIPLAVDAMGEIYALSAGYENLYEVCKTIATQSGFGWRIDFDGANLTLVCFTGEDKSNTVQFSTDMDSLSDGTYTDTADSYANCIYVGGKGQNAEQEIYEGEQDGAEGLARYEAYDSNSDLTTEDEYEAEALSMLTQYAQTVTLSGNGLAKCPYEFKNQYNVGDYITVSFSGHKAKVQILSVTQNWAWNNYSLSFEFGKPQNTLDEQLQLLLKKVQSGEKPRTTDSVFWYTIPTDTEQSKDEVKYNTIGFIGDCGAGGSTFKLYLDNEKNGSKSYHIYFKELAGKTLTLTTGRAGAHDLTVSTGTYVLIVYVDENGNITEQGTTTASSVVSGNTQPVSSDAVIDYVSGGFSTWTDITSDWSLAYSSSPSSMSLSKVFYRNSTKELKILVALRNSSFTSVATGYFGVKYNGNIQDIKDLRTSDTFSVSCGCLTKSASYSTTNPQPLWIRGCRFLTGETTLYATLKNDVSTTISYTGMCTIHIVL